MQNKWQHHNNTRYRTIKKSDSTFIKLLGFILKPINKRFMTNYTTTIGHTIYTPENGMSNITLLHELVHVKQWQKWNILFSLSYLFVLPFGVTMRGYWERQAYEVNIKDMNSNWGDIEKYMDGFKDHIISQFTSSNYLYMDIRKEYLSKWFDGVIEDIENEQ